jgi:hypothetical protein
MGIIKKVNIGAVEAISDGALEVKARGDDERVLGQEETISGREGADRGPDRWSYGRERADVGQGEKGGVSLWGSV